MPFGMDTSMHAFVLNQRGGVQTVTVRNRDPKQISLVRSHLHKEAAAFARGDFSDPASIHGRAMPGLGLMHAGSARIHMVYSDVPNGARITYSTTDPELIAAIHSWFKTQVGDHGSHATMKM